MDAQRFLQTVPESSGVYQMYNHARELLYVGKAHNLKKRLASYFRDKAQQSPKTAQLMTQVTDIETIVTNTENEALLLECNLIKRYRPKYNVLLRDDKSYPYLHLSTNKTYPRLSLYRGSKGKTGQYYGPYPSVNAVRETLTLMQKLFKLRQCNDTFFSHRSRPCLQYQIKRCTAPCVGFISPEAYQRNVRYVQSFLEGNNEQVIQGLIEKMEEASEQLDFEEAAKYRDQIAHIRHVQSAQTIEQGLSDIDAVAIIVSHGVACVNVVIVRQGRVVGSKPFFLKAFTGDPPGLILAEFLPQYYLGHPRGQGLPKQVFVNKQLEEQKWVARALTEQLSQSIQINHNARGQPRQWLQLAQTNAEQALRGHLSTQHTTYQRLEALQEVLSLESVPERLECFDISHTQGESPVASAVVFDQKGAKKDAYRRFNIRGVTPGDDYNAIKQALHRRYKRLKEQDQPLPDVLIIDGGPGQLAQAETVLDELQVTGIMLLGVAKGEGRKPGLETIHIGWQRQAFQLSPDSQALHLIQQLRDEAHRFALKSHRQQRGKKHKQSTLEDIPNVGPKRRQTLLKHFGGMQGVKAASVDDLAKVSGINTALARQIYQALHGQ